MIELYKSIRKRSVAICQPLSAEDSIIQPIADVSPPKWHLAHTSWFFETFILKPYVKGYAVFNEDFNFLYNSYYEGIGDRVPRDQRGNISRPGLAEILGYRNYVDHAMHQYLDLGTADNNILLTLELGLQHEQQHQELLLTDIKYILSTNPLLPVYDHISQLENGTGKAQENEWLVIPEGVYGIGFNGNGFCFDNELGRHKVYLHAFQVERFAVKNKAYAEFISEGGYANYALWLADGWDWIKKNKISAPLYWYQCEQAWKQYTLKGLLPLDMEAEVCHVSFYEADAFARWMGARLLTEFEWETASGFIDYGSRWEWTNSAYLPYPFFQRPEGAIGEYNGKFMINQMVLRGGSVASPPGHVRNTYRNFFPPDKQWQYSGIRLAKSL